MDHPSFPLLGAVMVVIVFSTIITGCVNQSLPGQFQPASPYVATSPNSHSAVPLSYHDTELLAIGEESGNVLGPLLLEISEDASRKDIAELGTDSANLSALASEYYFKMKDLYVSPKYQNWKTNYSLGLLDAQTAGDYFSKSATAAQMGDYTTALTYLEQGKTLFNRSNVYINVAKESIPK